jgi:hypothetical protein
MFGRGTLEFTGSVGPPGGMSTGIWLSEMWLRDGYGCDGSEREGIEGEGTMFKDGSHAGFVSAATWAASEFWNSGSLVDVSRAFRDSGRGEGAGDSCARYVAGVGIYLGAEGGDGVPWRWTGA